MALGDLEYPVPPMWGPVSPKSFLAASRTTETDPHRRGLGSLADATFALRDGKRGLRRRSPPGALFRARRGVLELAPRRRVLHVLGTSYSVPHQHPRFLARIIWTCSISDKVFLKSLRANAFLHSSIHSARPLLEPLNIVQSIEDDLLTFPLPVV